LFCRMPLSPVVILGFCRLPGKANEFGRLIRKFHQEARCMDQSFLQVTALVDILRGTCRDPLVECWAITHQWHQPICLSFRTIYRDETSRLTKAGNIDRTSDIVWSHPGGFPARLCFIPSLHSS
jgi:hypothetical protein